MSFTESIQLYAIITFISWGKRKIYARLGWFFWELALQFEPRKSLVIFFGRNTIINGFGARCHSTKHTTHITWLEWIARCFGLVNNRANFTNPRFLRSWRWSVISSRRRFKFFMRQTNIFLVMCREHNFFAVARFVIASIFKWSSYAEFTGVFFYLSSLLETKTLNQTFRWFFLFCCNVMSWRVIRKKISNFVFSRYAMNSFWN